jgi:immune inhibitor A
MNYTKKLILISITISIIYSDLASPTPFTEIQPNGIQIEIFNRGNHLQGWHEYNGWTIVKSSGGWWYYASGSNGNKLTPSSLRAGIDEEPSPLSSLIQKGIRPEPFVLIDEAPIPDLNNTRTDTFKVPLILVEFPDAYATYDSSDFDLIMNQPGYTHLNYDNTGSFRDFYQEISHGQFLPVAEVSNWFLAPNEHDYYAYSDPDGYPHVRQLVRDMVDSLEASGFDWSIYDNDGDGYVDALNLVHQGAGAEEGDYSNIWSHKWSLGNLAVSYDGVTISSYNINPEIQNGSIVAIGVLAHEFGHALGLPDLYDTDYTSSGAGKLALMASGAWGTSNNSPWYPSTMVGWCKNELGWVDIIDLTEDQDNISIQQSYSNNDIIRINHPQAEEEYWLIENRQNIGSDTLIPSAGLAIWHINDDIAQGWGVNNNEPYYGVGLEQADGMFALENSGPSNGGDIYPGDTDNREFSHASSPNTTSLYGIPSMTRVDNISDPGEFMTFDLTYGEIILATASITDGSGYAYNQGTISLGMNNEMELGALEFELNFSPSFVNITDVLPTERTSFDSVIIEDNHITLVNPTITAGTGNILDVQLFNNVGVEADVIISYSMCLAYTTEGQEVGITVLDDADYTIQAVDQFYTIQNSSGMIGGGASYVVSIINTVPIAMTIFQILNSPSLLTPSDEPFEDLNENDEYDDGEPFVDWNQNSYWSPMIEPLSLSSAWQIDASLSGTDLTIGISNWDEPLEPAAHQLFRVNCEVSNEAELNDIITVSTNVMLVLDAWGNNGVPFVNGDGTITIDGVLANDGMTQFPTAFSLDEIYPNPFNPVTSISFSIPINNNEEVTIQVYDLKGRIVAKLAERPFQAGNYKVFWDATGLSSGIYFTEFNVAGNRTVKKVTLLK